MMDFIILAEEETMTSTLTPFQPQLDAGTMFLYAGIVISVVFAVLFIMYACISIASKIISKLPSGEKKAETASAAPAPAAAAPAPVAEEEFSSGTLKLKGCDEKTAAMIMAIVSDNTGIPLSELVFKSITLVENK